MRRFESHGTGTWNRETFAGLGDGVIFEEQVLVFHGETISIGTNVYIGHRAILKGHPNGTLKIGNNTWIGQDVFIHSAGGVTIGNEVGIGPKVSLFTSFHADPGRSRSILDSPLEFRPIQIDDGADLGVGCVVLPGVHIGEGAQIGAGSVVTRDIPPFAVAAGNPARVFRYRP